MSDMHTTHLLMRDIRKICTVLPYMLTIFNVRSAYFYTKRMILLACTLICVNDACYLLTYTMDEVHTTYLYIMRKLVLTSQD